MMKRMIPAAALIVSLLLTGCGGYPNMSGTGVRDGNDIKNEDPKDNGPSEPSGKDKAAGDPDITYDDGKPFIDSDLKVNVTGSKCPDIKDDFHFAVNHDWLKGADIKEGFTSESSFTCAERNTKERAMSLLGDSSLAGHDAELVRSLYEAVTDWDKRNEQGIEPLRPVITDIAGIKTLDGLSNFICDPKRSNCVSAFVSIMNETDLNDSGRYIVYINNDTLLLEDAAEYAELTSAGERAYEAKMALVKAMYSRLGIGGDEAEARFNRVLGFEEKIAEVALTRKDFNGPDIFDKVNNIYTEEEIKNLTKAFPLQAFIEGFGYGGAGRYAVYQPKVIQRLDELYTEANLDVMKDYMTIHYLIYAADKLDRECYDLSVARINAQYGITGSTDDEVTAYNTILKLIPEPFEKVYLEKYDAAEMKDDITGLCKDVIGGYREMLKGEEWLSVETRNEAVKKLESMKINAVYPDKWQDYDTLDLKGLGYLECCHAINAYNAGIDRSRTGQRVDNDIWTVNILQCNAFYNKQDNSINIILGILDDAFYNEDMSREELLGGIGTVIGHEISHAFDEKGSQFDENGNLKAWWKDEDHKAYGDRMAVLSGYFDGITGFNGTNVIGSNVSAEAAADMAGMKVMLYLAGKEPDFDYDRFFRQYASIWRTITSPEAEYDKLLKDQHPLNYLRTNVTLQQYDEFYEEYGINEGDGMYLAPEERVAVW